LQQQLQQSLSRAKKIQAELNTKTEQLVVVERSNTECKVQLDELCALIKVRITTLLKDNSDAFSRVLVFGVLRFKTNSTMLTMRHSPSALKQQKEQLI